MQEENQENRLRELSSKLYAKIEQIDGELGRYDKRWTKRATLDWSWNFVEWSRPEQENEENLAMLMKKVELIRKWREAPVKKTLLLITSWLSEKQWKREARESFEPLS